MLHDQFQQDWLAACAVFTCNPLPPPINVPFPLIVNCREGIQPWDMSLPLPPVQTSKIKQSFLSINFASLFAFEPRVAGPHFQYEN